MKKSHIAMLIAAGLALSPLALAKKNAPDPLVDIIPGPAECVESVDLTAAWSWSEIVESSEHTKFGGDVEYTVKVMYDATVDDFEDNPTMFTLELEFEVEKHIDGTVADTDYPSQFVYSCVGADCGGTLYNLDDVILAAAAAELEADLLDVVILPDEVVLEGVYIKGMDPAQGNKRQNYPKVDICVVPA